MKSNLILQQVNKRKFYLHISSKIHLHICFFLLGVKEGLKGLTGPIYLYSRVRNKHSPTLIIFLIFFQGLRPYYGLHRAYFSTISIRYKWGYAYSFCQIFHGLCLFKGLRLFQTLEYICFLSLDSN